MRRCARSGSRRRSGAPEPSALRRVLVIWVMRRSGRPCRWPGLAAGQTVADRVGDRTTGGDGLIAVVAPARVAGPAGGPQLRRGRDQVGQPCSSGPASSPATSMSSWRARWSTSKSSSPTVRMSREVSGICVVSKSASSMSAKARRRSASKVAGLPDQVAQVDHQLGAVDQVGLVHRERPGELLGGSVSSCSGVLLLEVVRVDVGQLVVRRGGGRWPAPAPGRRRDRGTAAGSRARPRRSLQTRVAAWCSSWVMEPRRSQVSSAVRVSTGVPFGRSGRVGLAHEPMAGSVLRWPGVGAVDNSGSCRRLGTNWSRSPRSRGGRRTITAGKVERFALVLTDGGGRDEGSR